jgi:hypothetical protein
MSIRTDFINKTYPLTRKEMVETIYDLSKEVKLLRDMILKNKQEIWLLNNPFKFKPSERVRYGGVGCVVYQAHVTDLWDGNYRKSYDVISDNGKQKIALETEITPCSTD